MVGWLRQWYVIMHDGHAAAHMRQINVWSLIKILIFNILVAFDCVVFTFALTQK